jgi:hypothetical protein
VPYPGNGRCGALRADSCGIGADSCGIGGEATIDRRPRRRHRGCPVPELWRGATNPALTTSAIRSPRPTGPVGQPVRCTPPPCRPMPAGIGSTGDEPFQGVVAYPVPRRCVVYAEREAALESGPLPPERSVRQHSPGDRRPSG